jgi:DeoR/GlpR family transcriptional regulator of sugar metabolism
MIDLPKGFSMHCIDLKQILDEKANVKPLVFDSSKSESSFLHKIDWIKIHTNYPKQTNEHNALADAKWNFELYKFLKSL